MKNIIVSSILIILFGFLSCNINKSPGTSTPINAQTEPEETTTWDNYFPMKPGLKWIYDSHIESAASRDVIRTIEIVGKEKVDSVLCTVFVIKNNGELTTKDYLKSDAEGIALYRQYSNGSLKDINPPDYRYKNPVEPGERWEWEGTFEGLGDVTFKYLIEAEEEVSLPMDTFNTIKLVTTAYESRLLDVSGLFGSVDVEVEPIYTSTQWLAKDVGIVKEVFQIENVTITSILKSFKD